MTACMKDACGNLRKWSEVSVVEWVKKYFEVVFEKIYEWSWETYLERKATWKVEVLSIVVHV